MKIEIIGVPIGWVVVALAYHCSFKMPFVMYILIDLDSIDLYLLSANLIISLLYSVWSSFYAISYKD